MNKTAEVIIIGGGVVGCAAAYYQPVLCLVAMVMVHIPQHVVHSGGVTGVVGP